MQAYYFRGVPFTLTPKIIAHEISFYKSPSGAFVALPFFPTGTD